jgi:Domain of unknown function (DUF4037)
VEQIEDAANGMVDQSVDGRALRYFSPARPPIFLDASMPNLEPSLIPRIKAEEARGIGDRVWQRTFQGRCARPKNPAWDRMPHFIPGLELSRRFYTEVVRGLVKPPHAACLLGEGSEVLGYDQPRSADHAWGPRLQIFVAAPQVEAVEDAIVQALPARFQGWPVRFFKLQTGTVTHHVEVTTLENWLCAQLGFDPRLELTTASWLALSQQRLLQVTAGAVFHDDAGDLTSVRRLLAWYPRDVWLWLLESQWH